jgi:hypothetical protein
MDKINFHMDGHIDQSNIAGDKNISLTGTMEQETSEEKAIKSSLCKRVCAWTAKEKSFLACVVLIVFLGIHIGCHIGADCVINEESIVLTAVGILATFVVIGNYFQVKDVEKTFEGKLNEAERRIRRDAQRYITANSSMSLLRISSGVSKIPLTRTDALIDLLGYAIHDYARLQERRPAFIEKILENTQYLYTNNLFILSEPETVKVFLDEFIKLKDQDSQVESLTQKIKQMDEVQRQFQKPFNMQK